MKKTIRVITILFIMITFSIVHFTIQNYNKNLDNVYKTLMLDSTYNIDKENVVIYGNIEWDYIVYCILNENQIEKLKPANLFSSSDPIQDFNKMGVNTENLKVDYLDQYYSCLNALTFSKPIVVTVIATKIDDNIYNAVFYTQQE